MQPIKKIMLLSMGCFLLSITACKKDNQKGPTVPELTTTAVTSVNSTTATSGGSIISNGGEVIVASGICWSTSATPTISNDTTKGSTATGSFTATLKNILPSTKYYVRAYATNRVGTGYGNVVEFTSGNAAPAVTNVVVTGTIETGQTLTATYTYSDHENDAQSGTTFKWYMADNVSGANETVIAGATSSTFVLQAAQFGKFIRVGVTPKAATGTVDGLEVKSAFRDGEATTVTFMYNSQQVTYGILLSNTTGKKWLDRNLGATRPAEAINDHLAYGHLFQWGRAADGHQIVTRTGPTDADATVANGTTTTKSSSSTAPDAKFILTASFGGNGDWLVTQNDNLWQGVNGVNNPCPTGWRLPTKDEFLAENITSLTDGLNKLKFSYTGSRSSSSGNITNSENFGFYWSSTTATSGSGVGVTNYAFISGTAGLQIGPNGVRANGIPCRCIKN